MFKKKLITGAVAAMIAFSAVCMPVNTYAQTNVTQKAEQLDKLAYSGGDLGAVYGRDSTTFKVWAPTASEVKLRLYTTGSDAEDGAKMINETPMGYQSENGIWSVTAQGDLDGVYYTYLVTVDGKTNETADIYAKAAGVNGERSMVVDLAKTDPEGWDSDQNVLPANQTEAIVWEIHVKDFSNDASSGVSEKNRGKYLAFTEKGTTLNGKGQVPTGVDYLKELGVNSVQINPFYDYGSVDEASSDKETFNWGYDPKNYNVPEGSYSSDPYDGHVRINEAKQMIQSLHEAGISVIMDVVYNHTFTGEDSFFNKTVPGYYYRFLEDGSWSNDSGCGNDTASEHEMYRKFMVDSVLYWAQEYHIDGFRFDLMGLHDVKTMNLIRSELDKLPNGKKIIMYGEAWDMAKATSAEMASQKNMDLLSERIGAFNDGIRDVLKGDNFNAQSKGFVQGKGAPTRMKRGIKGAVDDWAKQPSQTVTYASCHDNMTLYDKLVASVKGEKEDYRQRYDDLVGMNKLSAAVTLTSQGISFMLAGEEMGRSKDGDHNSYKSPASLNQIDWNNLVKYKDLVAYYAGLTEIRKNFAPFTSPDKTSVDHMVFFENTDKHVVGYTLKNTVTAGTQWDQVACIFNSSTDEDITVELEGENLPKEWVVVADGEKAGVQQLKTVNGGKVTVPKSSALILVDQESFERAGIKSESTLADKLSRVTAQTVEPTQGQSSAQDENNMNLPLVICIAAALVAAAVTGFIVYSKKKKR